MSIVTEILSLRRDQTSTVERLLAAVEWEKSAEYKIPSRVWAVREAADAVLTKVAAYAADASVEPSKVVAKRRASVLSRRRRRYDPGQSQQRVLFLTVSP